MQLHKRMALLFFSFTSFVLIANLFAPTNPDQLLNIIEMSVLSVGFFSSYFLSKAIAGTIQTASLGVSAFIPMADPLSSFFGGVLAVFMLVLIYAYGGYRTYPIQKLIFTFFGMFALCVIASSNFHAPTPEIFVRAFAWTAFIGVFCFTLWLIVDDINKNFYDKKERELLEQNRELLEINKMLLKGCADEPGKR